jgi:hypothetical protein
MYLQSVEEASKSLAVVAAVDMKQRLLCLVVPVLL